ncbi:hypothetical protein ACFYTS_10725 [Nocardia sp. NPDC004151]|uniref:hypothetical protein n=1 Tax=Nocardia sp. NPDC004151 TaxID=3364304 RepID=UPI0036D1DDBF
MFCTAPGSGGWHPALAGSVSAVCGSSVRLLAVVIGVIASALWIIGPSIDVQGLAADLVGQ